MTKILSITTAQTGWFARYSYRDEQAEGREKVYFLNDAVVVWGLIQDDDVQRVVGFCADSFAGGLFIAGISNEEATFRGYVYEEQQPTKGKKS